MNSLSKKINPKKMNGFSASDNYQIYQGKSTNGYITRNYYYINGVKCNAFGQVMGDPGYNPYNKQGQYVPVSYPSTNRKIRTSGKKKKHPQLWGLSSYDILEIKKKIIENRDKNKTRLNIANNQRTKWEKKHHFSHNYPPTPALPPYPSNTYIIPTSYSKIYYVFPWSKYKL